MAPLNLPAITDPTDLNRPTIVAAPWTGEQVDHLNRYQQAATFHPFTCGRRDQHPENPGVLVATVDGWHCPADGCNYRQTWALPFMAEAPTAAMTAREVGMQQMREIAARPTPCLRHEDIHGDHGAECFGAYVRWWSTGRRHLKGQSARDAYALEVEQRILNRLVREHAPAHRINPALSK